MKNSFWTTSAMSNAAFCHAFTHSFVGPDNQHLSLCRPSKKEYEMLALGVDEVELNADSKCSGNSFVCTKKEVRRTKASMANLTTYKLGKKREKLTFEDSTNSDQTHMSAVLVNMLRFQHFLYNLYGSIYVFSKRRSHVKHI